MWLRCDTPSSDDVGRFLTRSALHSQARFVQAFPQALLQELLAVVTGWQPPQRALAHELFGAVLPAANGSLASWQTHSVLSALWHEVGA